MWYCTQNIKSIYLVLSEIARWEFSRDDSVDIMLIISELMTTINAFRFDVVWDVVSYH